MMVLFMLSTSQEVQSLGIKKSFLAKNNYTLLKKIKGT